MRARESDKLSDVNSTIGRAATVLVAVAAVAVAAVVATDRWRASGVHPPDCGSVILVGSRGAQTADTGLQTDAWSIVTDPEAPAVGQLDGPRPVLDRSCLLYAGPTGVADDPSVGFVESTFSGHTELLRIVEVAPGSGRFAGAGYPVLIGSETTAGVVLPLSGVYLAPPDVDAVTVLGAAERPGKALAPGVFELDDKPAMLLLRRSDRSAPVLVVVPVLALDGGQPLRIPFQVSVDGLGTADAATLQAVEQVLPLFLADKRLPALIQRAPGRTTLGVRTAVINGGRGVVVGSSEPGPVAGLPEFRYFVPTAGPAVAVP